MNHETEHGVSRSICIEITPSRVTLLDVQSNDGLANARVKATEVSVANSPLQLSDPKAAEHLVEALRPLVHDFSLHGQSVTVLLGGEYCATRVLRGDEDAIRRNMQDLEKLKQHYMGLGRGEKALASVVRSIDARQERATIAIAIETTLDTLIEAAQALGIELGTVEPTTVALARLCGHLNVDQTQPVAVVTTDAAGTDVGLVYKGELLLHHRLRAPLETDGEVERVGQQLSLIAQYAVRFSQEARENTLPVFVLTNDRATTDLELQLHSDPDLDVRKLDATEILPDWQWDHEHQPTSVWPAIGGCLRAFLGHRAAPTPDLVKNLTGTSHLKVVMARRKMVFPLVAAGLIGLALGSAAFWEKGKAEQLRSNLGRFASSEQELEMTKMKYMQARRFNESTKAIGSQVSGIDWQRELRLLAQCKPAKVWLKRVALSQDGTLTITGTGDRDESIHDFQKSLDSAPPFGHVQVVSTRPGQRPQFEMECNIRGRAGY